MKLRKPFCTHILCLIYVVANMSCQSAKNSSSLPSVKPSSNNNLITQKAENVHFDKQGNDKIIFEGGNNIVEIIQKNSFYFDGAHDVIVIKGDGNIIRLYNINIVDLRQVDGDTVVIVGNREKYVYGARNAIITKSNVSIDTIELNTPTFDASSYSKDFATPAQQEERIVLSYFGERVTPRHAYEVFAEGIQAGKVECYYELAELYLYGVGVAPSTEKAVELYEFAVAKDHIPSIRRLAEIYEGKFDHAPRLEQSQYYYKRGSLLGDEYCTQFVKRKK